MSRKTNRRELTEFDKGRIVGLADCGKNLAEISKQLDIPRSTVRDFIKRSKERGHYENVPRPGRPRKTTEEIDKLIVEVTDDRSDSLEDIQKQIVPELSVRTIKRRIREAADRPEIVSPVSASAPGSSTLQHNTLHRNSVSKPGLKKPSLSGSNLSGSALEAYGVKQEYQPQMNHANMGLSIDMDPRLNTDIQMISQVPVQQQQQQQLPVQQQQPVQPVYNPILDQDFNMNYMVQEPIAADYLGSNLFDWQNSKQAVYLFLLDVRPIWNSQNDFNQAMRLLPVESQLDISRFRYRSDAKMALGSQLLQRYIATVLTGKKWTDIVISKTPQGKSFVPNSPFDYNISHHSELVVVAVRPDGKQIGVDITSTVPPSNWTMNWMEGFSQIFSPYEYSQVTSDTTGNGEFFLRWALKESYSKAIGMGLNMDLAKLEFRNLDTARLMEVAKDKTGTDGVGAVAVQRGWSNSSQLWIDGVIQDRWHHELFMLNNNQVIALATHKEGVNEVEQVRLRNLTMEELMSRALPFGPAVAMQPHSNPV
ncbi:L-aminoadipate-semialdehyde dehydrogenase-phosphopantetheinyl transferase [Yarrowia sp. B02]|nr:L-aminoadipate-semialdehyde dehydrogenase-phosphopantetheinyl transferase [Yarrowia sp. B02]